MYYASFYPYQLHFKEPAGTSRGVIKSKASYFIEITSKSIPGIKGIGECSILKGLSIDDKPGLVEKLDWVCENINLVVPDFHLQLQEWPAIRFAVEMALLDLANGGRRIYFNSGFTSANFSIPINGLIWMGSIDQMRQRVSQKLEEGFKCLKIKIGALDFESELEFLRSIRNEFSAHHLEIRVDANGAYSPAQATVVLDKLAGIDVHSVEQPIKAGQWDSMAGLIIDSPVPIALDEELIGINTPEERLQLLRLLKPHYIVLKPSLVGGFISAANWIELSRITNTGWWVTSALESNIGLNAIAQWTATLNNSSVQGLGTGNLFENNILSPLVIKNGRLTYKV